MAETGKLQADSLGAEYMVKQGYSASGMINTISVLKEHEIYSNEVSKEEGLCHKLTMVFLLPTLLMTIV
ncbi:MAG: hypothetical protein Ct9H300mP20_20030 [Gammaproteobacteria bacterium]|nr:MAG: hypothetical protein Ct9H300mP20_20030 [Gammaproteobacteria bacterium]